MVRNRNSTVLDLYHLDFRIINLQKKYFLHYFLLLQFFYLIHLSFHLILQGIFLQFLLFLPYHRLLIGYFQLILINLCIFQHILVLVILIHLLHFSFLPLVLLLLELVLKAQFLLHFFSSVHCRFHQVLLMYRVFHPEEKQLEKINHLLNFLDPLQLHQLVLQPGSLFPYFELQFANHSINFQFLLG